MDYENIRLAWVDLETTGLTPGAIIEVACIITDRQLNEITRLITPVKCEQKELDTMHPAARQMHQENGLLDRLAGAPSASEVEVVWADMLKRVHEGDPKRVIMVGNSIGALDMPFIQACMPRVAKEMHYRSMDITGLRIALGVWSGENWEFEKKKTHRAEDDIIECQSEFKYQMDKMKNFVLANYGIKLQGGQISQATKDNWGVIGPA